MPGWERARWRSAAAAAAICAVLVAVVLVLVAEGLGAAASLVGVLSVVSVIAVVAAWGRARPSSPERIVGRRVELAGLLRDIAEAHAWSRSKIREALGERDVDAVMDGTRLPEWDVVAAFLGVIADGDQAIREGLEHLVRPVWEAAREQADRGSDGASCSHAPDVGGAPIWIAASKGAPPRNVDERSSRSSASTKHTSAGFGAKRS